MLNVVGHKRDWDRRKFGKALQATSFLLQVSFFQATSFLIYCRLATLMNTSFLLIVIYNLRALSFLLHSKLPISYLFPAAR
jgi:hypothetical protein